MLSQLRTAASRTSPRTFALRAVRSYSSTGALARETGTVKFFNTQKGFGFVEPDAGGGDLFMHATGIRGAEVGKYHEVADETRVEYDLAEEAKGERAVDVSLEGGDELAISSGFAPRGGRGPSDSRERGGRGGRGRDRWN